MKRTLIVVNKREKGNIIWFPKTLFNKTDLNSQLKYWHENKRVI